MHAHPAHAHYHDHSADAHGLSDRRYSIAIGLNLGFVAIEAAAGFYANSTALFSDAAHNLSDVLGLALAGGAAWLAQRAASDRRTYGFSKATVLAALANALVLVGVCGGILWEAMLRFATPANHPAAVCDGDGGVGRRRQWRDRYAISGGPARGRECARRVSAHDRRRWRFRGGHRRRRADLVDRLALDRSGGFGRGRRRLFSGARGAC